MRPDLLQLDDEKLAVLANRGLVKRARKLLGRGTEGVLSWEGETLVVRFDAITVTLPPGVRLEDTECTCGASRKCWHRVAAVMLFREQAPDEADEASEAWCPSQVDDEALGGLFGASAMRRAKARMREGMRVEVRRHPDEARGPTVVLPTATVRFLVAGHVELAHTDTDEDAFGYTVILAVWAMRHAREEAPDEASCVIHMGGSATSGAAHEALRGTIDGLLRRIATLGIVNLSELDLEGLDRAALEANEAGLAWVGLTLEDLAAQLRDHATRGPTYRPRVAAGLWMEARSRLRAAGYLARDEAPVVTAAEVLGDVGGSRTRSKQVRLVSLGARVRRDPTGTGLAIYLHDIRTATTLKLEKRWEHAEDEPLTGPRIARRSLHSGIPFGGLAAGQIVTQNATRHVSRRVTIGRSRVAKSVVQGQSADWAGRFAEPTFCASVAALRAAESAQPPSFLRPRVVATDLHVIEVSAVVESVYEPAADRVTGVLLDTAGEAFLVQATADPAAPGRLSALADALEGGLRYVAGHTRLTRAGMAMVPTALVTDRVIVPDLAEPKGPVTLRRVTGTTSASELALALNETLDDLAQHLHSGLRLASAGSGSALRGLGCFALASQVEASASDPDELLVALTQATLMLERAV